jgi:hypothetical protein
MKRISIESNKRPSMPHDILAMRRSDPSDPSNPSNPSDLESSPTLGNHKNNYAGGLVNEFEDEPI